MKRTGRTKGMCCLIVLVLLLTGIAGCAGEKPAPVQDQAGQKGCESQVPDISAALTYEGAEALSYAEQFTVDRYADGYVLLRVANDRQYLVVPEGGEIPADLPADVIPLCQPLDHLYLVASAAMDMFVKLDALSAIRFSGTAADGWYIPEAKAAMEGGQILYAGKYSAPDYEQILSEGCKLAVENTMVLHTPDVKEQLERLGIPVLIDYSSYESTPQGRMEWILFYGILLGKEEEARQVLSEQIAAMEGVADKSATEKVSKEKTVAFFYITSGGAVNVRRPGDYLPKMIELAGGSYVCPQLKKEDSSASSSANVQMEAFYAAAKDADYLIYNSSIDDEVADLTELKTKDELLGRFAAVKEGRVFCTSKNLYQASMELGAITADIRKMLDGETEGFTYLYQLK